jgi:mono/diheme cytochrome c family protein
VPGHSGISGYKHGKWNWDYPDERLSSRKYEYERPGGTVNRNFLILGTAALAFAGAVLAQDPPPAKKQTKKSGSGDAAAVTRGKEIFDKKCGICHYADNDQKKIGPGLKGISKRGTFTVNNNKVTDETLKAWIENGDTLMPPFKDVLDPAQIKDVIAYVKTL